MQGCLATSLSTEDRYFSRESGFVFDEFVASGPSIQLVNIPFGAQVFYSIDRETAEDVELKPYELNEEILIFDMQDDCGEIGNKVSIFVGLGDELVEKSAFYKLKTPACEVRATPEIYYANDELLSVWLEYQLAIKREINCIRNESPVNCEDPGGLDALGMITLSANNYQDKGCLNEGSVTYNAERSGFRGDVTFTYNNCAYMLSDGSVISANGSVRALFDASGSTDDSLAGDIVISGDWSGHIIDRSVIEDKKLAGGSFMVGCQTSYLTDQECYPNDIQLRIRVRSDGSFSCPDCYVPANDGTVVDVNQPYGGLFYLVNYDDNECARSFSDEDDVEMDDCNYAEEEHWKMVGLGDGSFYFENPSSDKCTYRDESSMKTETCGGVSDSWVLVEQVGGYFIQDAMNDSLCWYSAVGNEVDIPEDSCTNEYGNKRLWKFYEILPNGDMGNEIDPFGMKKEMVSSI